MFDRGRFAEWTLVKRTVSSKDGTADFFLGLIYKYKVPAIFPENLNVFFCWSCFSFASFGKFHKVLRHNYTLFVNCHLLFFMLLEKIHFKWNFKGSNCFRKRSSAKNGSRLGNKQVRKKVESRKGEDGVGGRGLWGGGGFGSWISEDERNKLPSSIFMLHLIYIFSLLPIKADREHKDGDTQGARRVRGRQLTCQKQSTD